MKIAIVGAGWAGLAAALKLYHQYDVRVFEAAAEIGGRARSFHNSSLSQRTDCGQHILIGAYHNCFGLMQELGVDLTTAYHRQTLNMNAADNSLRLKYWPLPAPFNRLGVLFASRGLAGIQGRIHLLRVFKQLHQPLLASDMTAAQWLSSLGCPVALMDRLWQPLCLATTNTDLQRTQASIFATVLRDSLAQAASNSDIYIPKVTLDQLWPAPAKKLLGERLQPNKFIRNISQSDNGSWLVDSQQFDRLILATPADTAYKLLQGLENADRQLANWPDFQYSAIGTLFLQLKQPWGLANAMSMLNDNPSQHAWGQWLFDHSAFTGTQQDNLVSVVIGNARRYQDYAKPDIINGIIRQIQQQTGKQLPAIKAHSLITDKKATFDAVPGMHRPANKTAWDGLYLAGDWTDTGYPAVLEGAVSSGIQAAACVLD